MSTMLINNFGAPISGILHVGANRGQEVAEYSRETDRVVFFEAIPHLVEELRKSLEESGSPFKVVHACCSDTSGEKIQFNIANGGGDSSSMFEMDRLQELYPGIEFVDKVELQSETLDDLVNDQFNPSDFNVLVVDTQGADLKVLKGAEQTITSTIDFIYIEAAIEPLYEGGCTLEEIVDYLKPLGFSMRNLNVNIADWGNALFTRDRLLFEQKGEHDLAHGKPAQQSSTHGNNDAHYGPQLAVNGRFRQPAGSKTKLQDNAFWQVDLGKIEHVGSCAILNRRLRAQAPHPVDIKLSDDGETWTTIATYDAEPTRISSALIETFEVGCETRFIRLQAQGRHSVVISQFYAFP